MLDESRGHHISMPSFMIATEGDMRVTGVGAQSLVKGNKPPLQGYKGKKWYQKLISAVLFMQTSIHTLREITMNEYNVYLCLCV